MNDVDITNNKKDESSTEIEECSGEKRKAKSRKNRKHSRSCKRQRSDKVEDVIAGIYVNDEHNDMIVDYNNKMESLFHVKRKNINIFDCFYPKSGIAEDYGGVTCPICKSSIEFRAYRYEPNSIGFWVYYGKIICIKDIREIINNVNS